MLEFDSLKFPFLDGFLSHSDRMILARFQLAELGNFFIKNILFYLWKIWLVFVKGWKLVWIRTWQNVTSDENFLQLGRRFVKVPVQKKVERKHPNSFNFGKTTSWILNFLLAQNIADVFDDNRFLNLPTPGRVRTQGVLKSF